MEVCTGQNNTQMSHWFRELQLLLLLPSITTVANLPRAPQPLHSAECWTEHALLLLVLQPELQERPAARVLSEHRLRQQQ